MAISTRKYQTKSQTKYFLNPKLDNPKRNRDVVFRHGNRRACCGGCAFKSNSGSETKQRLKYCHVTRLCRRAQAVGCVGRERDASRDHHDVHRLALSLGCVYSLLCSSLERSRCGKPSDEKQLQNRTTRIILSDASKFYRAVKVPHTGGMRRHEPDTYLQEHPSLTYLVSPVWRWLLNDT